MSYCCQGQALGEDHDASCGRAPRPRRREERGGGYSGSKDASEMGPPPRTPSASAPLPAQENFHNAVAIALGMQPQRTNPQLLAEIRRLKRVEDEYLGLWQGLPRTLTHEERVGLLRDLDAAHQQAISDEQTHAEQSDAYRHSTEG